MLRACGEVWQDREMIAKGMGFLFEAMKMQGSVQAGIQSQDPCFEGLDTIQNKALQSLMA